MADYNEYGSNTTSRSFLPPKKYSNLEDAVAPTDRTARVVLDESDPFEKVLINIVETNRRKRADYAADGTPFSNFEETAGWAHFEAPWLSALFNVQQKMSRLKSLRGNGRLADPANEAVTDTLLDLAVYSIIAYAIYYDELSIAE